MVLFSLRAQLLLYYRSTWRTLKHRHQSLSSQLLHTRAFCLAQGEGISYSHRRLLSPDGEDQATGVAKACMRYLHTVGEEQA